MELYTTSQLAKILQVNPATVRRFQKEGMPVYNLGKRNFRFDINQVLEWVRNRDKKPPGRKPQPPSEWMEEKENE